MIYVVLYYALIYITMKLKLSIYSPLKPVSFFIIASCLALVNCSDDATTTPENPAVACTTELADAEKIQIFPATHPLNLDISTAQKDTRSDDIINFIGQGSGGVKADFGSGLWEGSPIGIPFVVVCKDQPKVTITYSADDDDDNYGDESDPGPFPIPLTAPVEGNGVGDSHVIAVDIDNLMLYELYNANRLGDGWRASSGAVFNLAKEEYRTAGWTSGDAAGLPIFPCLLRYDEVASGTVDHVIRFTIPKAKITKGYIHPARHKVAGGNTNPNIPTPMGMRLRLKASFDISTFSATNQTILKAMKKHGIILADIGSSFYITGAPDSRWNNDDLRKLLNVKPTDFEVVQMGEIQ
jgi:hypothetical protein